MAQPQRVAQERSVLPADPRALWAPRLTVVLLALVVKATLVAIALVDAGLSGAAVPTVETRWNQWDADHYLFLATYGYVPAGDERNFIAFFPLYPALIAVVGHVGIPLLLAPLLLSNLGSLLATLLLFEIARRETDIRAAWRTAALWNIFPTAYFLFNGYSEGVFCALAFGCVLATRQRWLLAGALGGLAAATRLTGLALLPFLLLELFMVRPIRQRVWRSLLPLALLPVGFLSYLWINWRVLNDPFAFLEVQRLHWYHQLSAPWVGLQEAVRSVFDRSPWERLTVGAGELLGGVTAYAIAVLSWLKLRPSDAAYATAVTVLVTFLPFWQSIPRYLLIVFPLFLLAGRVRNQFIQGLAASLSRVGLITFSVAFTRGIWAF